MSSFDLDGLPDSLTEIGSIHISLVMGSEGLGTTYEYEGVSIEAAIGHTMVVLDRLRDEASSQWGTCPGCGESYDEDDEDETDEFDVPPEGY